MEISAQSQDETEIQGSWIPNTPYKPILPEQPPIYPERQEHQPEQGNWLESEECPPGFPPETQSNKIAACLTSTYCPHNWKNGTATDNIGTCREFSMDVLSGLDNVRFGDLLALADAASVASVVGSDSTAKGPCFSNSYSQIDGSRMESSSVAFPYMKPDFSLRSNIWTASNGPLENSQDKLSNPQQHSYDLNFPPETMFNKMPQKMILDFAPITPEKAMRVEGNQLSETQNIFTEEGTNQETDKQRNEAAATNHSFEGLHSNKELPEPAGHSSLVAASTASKENHNPDKGHTQDVELNKTPQQKPKRKKHRPKVITEGKPRRTQKPTTPKPAASEKNPTGKRKYVRKKRVDKDSTPLPAVVSGESSDLKTLEQTKKSTRRALHFDTAEPGDENSACKSTLNLHTEPQAQDCCDKESQSTSTMQLIDIEVMIEDRQVGIADEFSLTVNPTLKEYIFLPEGQAPSTPLPTKTNPPRRRKRDANFQGNNKAGQVAAHNIQDNCLQIMLPTETQTLPGSPTDKGSTSTILTEEGQVRRSKRKYSRSTGQEHTSSTNVIGIQYNILQAYQTMSWIQFPKVNRKKRTEKGQCSTKASAASITAEKNIVGQEITCSHSDAKADPFASKANYWISTPPNASGMPAPLGAAGRDGAEDKLQTFECVTGFNQREGSTKKGSRGTTQVRDLASLSGIADCNIYSTYPGAQVPVPGCNRQAFENSHGPHTSMEAIVAEMQATLARKKRTKKRNSHMSPVLSSEKAMQIHPKIILHDHHQFFAPSSVAAPDALWKQEFSVDAISEQLKLLDINRETNHIPYCEQNALIPYIMGDQEQNALVLYRRDGAVVPFEGPFYPLKKRRSRPKVDLDDETNRVWKLLMGNINSEGIDGTDEEKAKWWEEERRVFHGRVDSFIARMHLVQGDRRFSPWKGSVVDSVVGVFLTQNVSDHLSSSAFMSLAARFPLKSNSNNKSCHEEGASSVTHEPVVYLVDLEDTMSDQPVCNQTSMTLRDTSHNEEKEVFNSDETSRSSGGIGSLTKESTCQLFDPGSGYSEVNRSTTEITGTRTVISVGHRRAKIDTILSQDSVLSPQNSLDLTTAQTAERTGSCSESNSEGEDLTNGPKPNSLNGSTSFMELLQMQGSTILQNFYSHENSNVYSDGNSKDGYIHAIEHDTQINNIDDPSGPKSCVGPPITSASYNSSDCASDPGVLQVESFEMFKGVSRSNVSRNKEEYSRTEKGPLRAKSMSQITEQDNLTVRVQQATRSAGGNNQSRNSFREDEDVIAQSQTTMLGDSGTIIESEDQVENKETDQLTIFSNHSGGIPDVIESTSALDNQITTQQKTHQSDLDEQSCSISKEHNELNTAALRSKGRKVPKEKKDHFDWDSFTRQVEYTGSKTERTANTMDSVDWEAVRSAEVNEISQTIKERGMNNMLAERIKDFLDRLVREHGSIDLEWLRDIPPDKAKEYLLSIRGLGLKSVECVRLLTLHHLAFPVDTNVGRIAVRLGWVPLQPLPESLQLHLLELYPILESIQKYLWPRLCKLDQRTLYELHYQMITFGKVFCTKSKPNCNACPMRGECRHFASAFASARLALPGPEERSIMSRNDNREPEQSPAIFIEQPPLPLLEATERLEGQKNPETIRQSEVKPVVSHCEPVIEEPATPEPECAQALENEMEDTFCEDPDEIPTIKLNMEEFTQNLQNYMQENMELQEGDMSKALVALTAEAASIPMPKLKNVSRLRTEHQVYELPDSHPLLKGLDKREPDDPCSYLLAIWTPGETANSIQPPEGRCSSQEHGKLCDENTCFSCNSIREAESHIVRGTLLIPCRTAMRGSFPLNGTYFQVNEVFADHDSSLNPINVPREWIWNLPRRTVYFGTSIPTIFKGLTTEGIQHCFWRGFVCVRGFDHKKRAPRPLIARLHFPASKLGRTKGKMEGDDN